MADITVTAANVHIYGGAIIEVVQFGEAMTAGQSTYQLSSDLKYYKADTDASAAAAAAKGVVITGAATGAYGVICNSGAIDVGATLTVGVPYIVSATAGGIAPAPDFAGYTGAFEQHLGYASAADTLVLAPATTGATN